MINRRQHAGIRWTLFLTPALLGGSVSGCDLVGPGELNSFALIRVNGEAVPYTIRRSRGIVDTGTVAELRWAQGSAVMFAGGRLELNLTSDVLFNGQPRETAPPHVDHHVDSYRFSDGAFLFRDFIGALSDDRRVLTMTDVTGLYDFATFEFERP